MAGTAPAEFQQTIRNSRFVLKPNPGITGGVSDIAHAILYLASDAAGFVTGEVLRPNGGVATPREQQPG